MPPKRKEVPAPEPAEDKNKSAFKLTNQELRSDWEETVKGEFECRLIIDEIVSAMEEEIVRTHMDHTSVPWTVQGILTDLMESLQLNFVEREEGTGFSDLDEDFGDATEEEENGEVVRPPGMTSGFDVHVDVFEPQTIVPDSWARASILNRKHLVRKEVEEPKPQTVHPKGSGRNRGLNSSDPLAATENIRSVPDAATSFTAAAKAQAKLKAKRQQQEAAEASIISTDDITTSPKTEEELQILSNMAAEQEKMSQLRDVSNKVEKQMHDLKNPHNQSIVVDGATHTVMLVNPPDPKILPPTVQEMKLAPMDEETDPNASKQTINRSRYGTPGPKKKTKKKGDAGQSNFWEAERNTEPMITNVAPSAGVTSREGDQVKRQDLKPQKLRLTKGEFQKQVKVQQTSMHVPDVDELMKAAPAKPPQPTKGKKVPTAKVQAVNVVNRATTGANVAQQQQEGGEEGKKGGTAGGTGEIKDPRKKTIAPQRVAELPRSRVSTPNLSRASTPNSNLAVPRPRKGDSHSPNTRHTHPVVDYKSRPNTPSVAGSAAKYIKSSRPASSMSIAPDAAEDDVARDFLDSIHISLNSTHPLDNSQSLGQF